MSHMTIVTSDIFQKCNTLHMCHTVTQCDTLRQKIKNVTEMQKYDNWEIKLDIVTLTQCDTDTSVKQKGFNSLDPQMMAEGT
jgi:predicted secreted Zn-dependent protease